jgi:ribose transport system substrate-binding protein
MGSYAQQSTSRRPARRLIALFAAFVVVAGACGGSATTAPSAAPATAAPASAAPASAAPASAAPSASEAAGVPAWCGTKQITLSVSDGFGGNNWRRITSGEAAAEAKKCPNITKYIYTDGQGDTQKAISDLNGLAAQGVNAMVVFPDAGEAMLPALRDAYKAGSVVVPYRVFPGGKDGVDYSAYVSTDFCQDGKTWGEWMIKALPNGGNVVQIGGPAGNSESTDISRCLHEVLDPTNIKIIGQQPFEVTNWDPALTQQVISAVLAKYPQIDGWVTDYAGAFASSLPAFAQAGRKVGPVASQDANSFGCESLKPGTGFSMMSVSAQNWMSRTAVQWAVALAAGGTPPASKVVPNFVFDDSLVGNVHCDASLPGDAILSSKLTKDEMIAVLK